MRLGSIYDMHGNGVVSNLVVVDDLFTMRSFVRSQYPVTT